jgi:hypothetical protein
MLSPDPQSRVRHRLMTLVAGCAILAGMVLLPACKSDQGADSGSSSRSGRATASGTGSMEDPKVAAQIESQYVIGPDAARELDCRVDWQNPQAGKNLRKVWVQGDSVFALDGQNLLSRILLKGGDRLWRVAAADPYEEILGVNFIAERVYVTTGGAAFVLDANTGALVGKQTLQAIANTQPVAHETYLLYGSRNGQAVWHSYPVGYQWRSYQVAPSIQVEPVLVGSRLAVVGTDGTIMVLDARNATQWWSKKLLSAVVAPPAIGPAAVYVAGTDQHVWAFDINDGRSIWRTLTESSLTQSPVLIGDFVYQQVPSQGLVCFDALPPDSPGGKIAWKAAGVAGNVVMRRRDQLYVWDAEGRRLTILDAKRGGVVKSIVLPRVKFLTIPDPTGQDADIIAADNDGYVVHLVPRT